MSLIREIGNHENSWTHLPSHTDHCIAFSAKKRVWFTFHVDVMAVGLLWMRIRCDEAD